MTSLFTETVETPVGPLLVGAVETGICLVEFDNEPRRSKQLERVCRLLDVVVSDAASELTQAAARQLAEYFDGERQTFDVPLAMAGTEFQQRVWKALTEIPYAATRSYADQSNALGDPRAIRAVASANGANPISIIVPCHRVIGADGSLTGYGGGVERKRWLLDHEQGGPVQGSLDFGR